MLILYLDASALVKSYVKEKGSEVLAKLMATVDAGSWRVLSLGIAEVVSILVRKHNSGALPGDLYHSSLNLFKQEILQNPRVAKMDATSPLIARALPLIENIPLMLRTP